MNTRRLFLTILLSLAGGAFADLCGQVLPQPNGVAVDASGRVLVAFTGRGGNGRVDLGVVVFDASGKAVLSHRVAAGAPGPTLGAGILLGSGSVTVAGSNAATAMQSDLVVARFHHPPLVSSVGEVAQAEGFSLAPAYPNPVNGDAAVTLRYRADAATRVRVTLLDANGRQLSLLRDEDAMPGEYRMQVSLGDRPAGLYFVEFQCGRDHRLAKLLKQ